jgi:hypothetical protein
MPLGNHCESLPDIFDRMKAQVDERFPRVLDQQRKLPWLSDRYFDAIAEGRATAGAPSAPRPSQNAHVGTPGAGQEQQAKSRCNALFEVSTVPPRSRVARRGGNDPLISE